MAIELPDAVRTAHVAAIRQYFASERGEEIGDLAATFLLDFVLETVGPSIYNQAIRDAQANMQRVVAELDLNLFEPERS